VSAVRQLTIALIKAGMDPVEATVLIARAGVEMAPPGDGRSPAARRQAAYRERNKASQNVTDVTHNETSQNITNCNEASQSDAASLSIESKKEEPKKKRESAKASQLPPDWQPDPESMAEAIALLGSHDRAELELKKFRNHAAEKGRTSKRWNQAWANWAIKAVEYGARNGFNGTGDHRTYPHAQQSGSATIVAGVAAAAERRGRERAAARSGGTVAGDADAASEPDFKFG